MVDTAINYRLQRAERSVGRALARLAGDEGIEGGREALFVCTKNGYLSSDGELSTRLLEHTSTTSSSSQGS